MQPPPHLSVPASQQSIATSPAPKKKSIKKFLLIALLIASILLIIVLLVVSVLLTGHITPLAWVTAALSAIAAIVSIMQLIPILFPSSPSPQTIIHNYHLASPLPPSQPALLSVIQPGTPIFCFNMPLRDPSQFYAREAARQTLINRITNGGSSSIVGERRIGKTWLLTYIQLIVSTHPALGSTYRVGYLDATNATCRNPHGFVEKALKELRISHHNPPSRLQLKHLSQAILDLKEQGITSILLIDEFEGFSSKNAFDQFFFEELRAIAQQEGLVLVTASKNTLVSTVGNMIGTTSPFFNIFQQISLKPFTQTEAEEFVNEKGLYANFSAIEKSFFLRHASLYDEKNKTHWPPLRLQLVGNILMEDKYNNLKSYQIKNLTYQQNFENRIREEYAAVVKL